MYRVVTKSMYFTAGQRRRLIHTGPWQPQEQWARKWADYLRSTGLYDAVEIESNRPSPSRERDFRL